MADIKISELTQAESLSLSDLMESAIPYNGGFQSRRMSLAQLSNYLENSVLHNALDTTAKNIIGAINEIVLDLANYYTTSQTYSKTEVDTLIAGVSGLHFLVVQTLPVSDIDPNTIYLVPKQDVGTQDIYDEFIYIVEEAPTPSHWEKIGTTEIDLSDYVTDTELATILNDYVTTSGLNTILTNYATTSAMTTALADKVDKVQGKGLSTEDYTTVEKAKLNGIASGAEVNVQSDWNATSGDAFIKNKPTIPTALSQLTDDSTHRVVTDSQITSWDNKSGSDTKVTQTNNSTDTYLPLLLANSTTSPETTTVKKSENLKANPSNGYLDVNAIRIHSSVSGSETKFARLYSENTVDRRYKLPVDKAYDSELAIVDDIPDALSDLTDDSMHRLVTDTEKSTWNDSRAISEVRLINEDLNDVTTVGFYYAAGGNTVTNKPTGYNNFGLVVIHNASGSQYTQIISNENGSYRRIKKADGTWTSWAEDKFTDSNVTQTNNTTSTAFPILLANSNTDTTETSGVKKNLGVTFQPSNGTLRMARPHTSTTTQDQQIVIGNNIENGTSGSVRGVISLYPKGSAWTKLFASEASETRSYFLPKDRPNNSEIAVTSDLASSNGLGAKNLLPYHTYHKNGYTSNGATFTVNEDGTVTVNRTTTSGTAQFYVTNNTVDGGLWLPNGTYYLSGCPEGGSTGTASGTYQLGVRYVKNNSTVQINDGGDGVSFTIDGSDYSNDGAWVRITLILRANVSASNMLWKPMVMFDSLADKSFSPPARTNRQLTLDKFDNYNVATKEYRDVIENNYLAGDYIIYKNKLYRVKNDISAGSFLYDNEIALTNIGKDLGNISRWQNKSFTASIGTDLSILDNNVVEFYINIPIQNAGTPIYMSTFISCDEIPITNCVKAISYYKTSSDNKYFELSFKNDRTTGKIILNIDEVYNNGSAVTSGNYNIEIWYRSFCKY